MLVGGAEGIKEKKKWDNCNSIINKIYFKKNLLIDPNYSFLLLPFSNNPSNLSFSWICLHDWQLETLDHSLPCSLVWSCDYDKAQGGWRWSVQIHQLIPLKTNLLGLDSSVGYSGDVEASQHLPRGKDTNLDNNSTR